MPKVSKHTVEEVLGLLDQVPGVTEFMNSFEVKMGQQIMARRISLGLTQSQLAELVSKISGESMPQSTISRVEGASKGIRSETYDKILRALGMSEVVVKFDSDKGKDTSNINII